MKFYRSILFLFMALSSINTYSQSLDSGLISHFPFNGNFLDSLNPAATSSNYGVQFSEGRRGIINGAANFSNFGNYFENQDYLEFANKISVGAWIKTEDRNTLMVIVSKYNSDEDKGFQLAINGLGDARFAVRNGDSEYYYVESNTVDVTDGEWHYIVGICDTTNIQVWVDGALEDEREVENIDKSILSNYELRFGSLQQGGQFAYKGQLDDFKLFNRALEAKEIVDIYESGVTNIDDSNDFFVDVYPNPTNNIINISQDYQVDSIELISTNGKVFHYEKSKSIDLTNFAPGMYYLKIHSRGNLITKKIYKQ